MSKDDMAFWLYSSGSTGFPKGAVHLHHDMLYVSDLVGKQVMQITEADRTFSAAKLFLLTGSATTCTSRCALVPQVCCCLIVLPPRRCSTPSPTTIPPFSTASPRSTPRCCKWRTRRHAMTSAHYACASPLANRCCPRSSAAGMTCFGLEICDMIGSTEALHVFIGNRPGHVRVGSTGEVLPGFEAKIVDDEGQEVGVDEVGTLLVKGDSTAPFYWNKHRKSQQTMLGEWLNTGDKFRCDTEGFYWYAGRSDDMLKVGGIWVSPIEVENTLLEHEAVLEAAVVGAEDSDALIKPKAYVVLRQGYTASVQLTGELQDFVKTKIAL